MDYVNCLGMILNSRRGLRQIISVTWMDSLNTLETLPKRVEDLSFHWQAQPRNDGTFLQEYCDFGIGGAPNTFFLKGV